MEQLKPKPKVHFTAQEYLEFEEGSSTKHELHEGRLLDMAGGTMHHSLISSNTNRALGNRLAGKPCLVLNSDLRVRIGKSVNYYYPDVSVVCGRPQFDPPDRQVVLTNPQLIVEVASESTMAFDSREKFHNYMRIESLREYVLIYQQRPIIDTFYRQDDGVWAIGPSFDGLDAVASLRLQGGVTLPLSEIYAGVEWPAPDKSPDVNGSTSEQPPA